MRVKILTWQDQTDRSATPWRAYCLAPVPIVGIQNGEAVAITIRHIFEQGRSRTEATDLALQSLREHTYDQGVNRLEEHEEEI